MVIVANSALGVVIDSKVSKYLEKDSSYRS
jgi:hypothetical protein